MNKLSKDVAVLEPRMMASVNNVRLDFINNITNEKIAKYRML